MSRIALIASPTSLSQRVKHRLKYLTPTGGGLRDDDWKRRHHLLSGLLVGSAVLLTVIGLIRDSLDITWVSAVVLIFCCLAGAVWLAPRRLPSSAVALGLTVSCAGIVMMFDGLIEAHFTFFITVGALALYRDWVPFLTFLVATVLFHAITGVLNADHVFNHAGTASATLVWVTVHGVAVLLSAGTQVVAWRLTESEERRADDDLSRAQAQFSAAFEEGPIAMSMMAADGRILRVNPAFSQWLGLPATLPPGFTRFDLPITAEPPGQRRILDRLLAGDEDTIHEERTYRHDNGQVFHVDLHSTALRDSTGQLQLAVTYHHDITEKRAHQEMLQRKVREDALTRLLNRSAFESDLADLIDSTSTELCVVYIDVDRFKAVNDSYGHSAGDNVLRALGGRLAATVPEDALVARLGGDEFAIALPGALARGQQLGAAIVQACAAPFQIAGGQMNVSVSVGICVSAPGEDAEAVLQSADLAMYAAKQSGRDQIKVFDQELRAASHRRVLAEHRLREALDGDRSTTLPVWFQPIVSLPTRQIIGAEALIRLRSSDGALVPPGDFIPIAEETGLVIPLGQHVLRTALAQLQTWGDRLPYVSVNVSPRQLSEAQFVPMLAAELATAGLADPSRLVLEITETSVLQSGVDLDHSLEAIKAMGVRLALDDFGTGYSSLTWLQAVPADIVKLDRSFVAGLATDPAKTAIISAVLWLAETLNMSVIAEGVEEPEDADRLSAARCPSAQGYLFSRPLEPDQLDLLLPAVALPPPPRVPAAGGPVVGGSAGVEAGAIPSQIRRGEAWEKPTLMTQGATSMADGE